MRAAAIRALTLDRGEPPHHTRRTLARSGGLLFAAGATLVPVSLAAERLPATNWTLVLVSLAAAYAVASLLLLLPDVVPESVYPYLTAGATALVTVGAYADGSQVSAVVLLYIWAALFACYFYSLWVALIEIAWISICVALELSIGRGVADWFGLWLLVTGTCLVGGLVVRQLVTQVRAEASRDPLTSLYNRRSLEEHLALDQRRAARTGNPLSIVMLDVDGLKALNDRAGHLEGDRYLVALAQRWQDELRGGDILARMGGDEFIVVMPDCTLERACTVADRLRAVTPMGCTASAGAAQWNPGADSTALIETADAALYRAKIEGRNRTIAATLPGRADLWGNPAKSTEREHHEGAVLEHRESPPPGVSGQRAGDPP